MTINRLLTPSRTLEEMSEVVDSTHIDAMYKSTI